MPSQSTNIGIGRKQAWAQDPLDWGRKIADRERGLKSHANQTRRLWPLSAGLQCEGVCVGGTSAAPAYLLDSGPVSGYGHALAGTTRPESPLPCEDRNRKMEIVVRRGSFGGNKLRRCEVRPHLNPLPGGEEVATLPPFWIPAFAGMTNGGPD